MSKERLREKAPILPAANVKLPSAGLEYIVVLFLDPQRMLHYTSAGLQIQN
jgi:hypothetical protein